MSDMNHVDDVDMLVVTAERADVEANRVDAVMMSLTALLRRDMCMRFRQRVNLAISGYDHDDRELYEVPEVRRFMATLDQQWPYWAFFLWPGHGTTIPMVLLTLISATSQGAGLAKYEPRAMEKLVLDRFGAMNQLCEWLGDSEDLIEEMSDSFLSAIQGRPE